MYGDYSDTGNTRRNSGNSGHTKRKEEKTMRTTRIQIEGDNGILAILNRASSETSSDFTMRYIATIDNLAGARRVKFMGTDIDGRTEHATVNL